MIKGTRIIEGEEASDYRSLMQSWRENLIAEGFSEIIVPILADPQLWIDRSGKEIEGQMWLFEDKGNRPTCLLPEVTAIIQDLYRESWSKSRPKPIKIFYESRCFRYERPQAGRYREFTQFGVEILGPNPEQFEELAVKTLTECLDLSGVDYELDTEAVRGLSYYSRNGFEARCEKLGAQKQIAGGGTYAEGCGWAIGLDRVLLARKS